MGSRRRCRCCLPPMAGWSARGSLGKQRRSVTSGTMMGTLGRLLDVFMRAAAEGWMTCQARDFRGSPTLLHYDGTKWFVSSLPSIPSTSTWDIRSITMISATEGWAVGEHEVKSPNYLSLVTPVILHYHNGQWSDYTWQDYLTPSPHGQSINIPVG